MCFAKYLVGVNSQILMSCHQLVGANSHSVDFSVALITITMLDYNRLTASSVYCLSICSEILDYREYHHVIMAVLLETRVLSQIYAVVAWHTFPSVRKRYYNRQDFTTGCWFVSCPRIFDRCSSFGIWKHRY